MAETKKQVRKPVVIREGGSRVVKGGKPEAKAVGKETAKKPGSKS